MAMQNRSLLILGGTRRFAALVRGKTVLRTNSAENKSVRERSLFRVETRSSQRSNNPVDPLTPPVLGNVIPPPVSSALVFPAPVYPAPFIPPQFIPPQFIPPQFIPPHVKKLGASWEGCRTNAASLAECRALFG